MRVLRARLYERELERQRAELDATRRSQIGTRRARREDPHLQLPGEPAHRPPDQADGAPARPHPPGRPRRVHRRAGRRGPAARARGVDGLARRSRGGGAPGRGGRGDPARRRRAAPRARARDDSRPALYAAAGRELEPRLGASCSSAASAREPLAYVLGEWGFRRLTLKTDARVLVPRPETEIVVERCLALLDEHRNAAGPRRRRRLRCDRARDRGRARRTRDVTGVDAPPRRSRSRARTRRRLGLAECVRSSSASSRRGSRSSELRSRRLEPAVRQAGRDRSSSSRRCGTGSRAARSSASEWASRSRPRPARRSRPEGWLVLETAAGTPKGSPSARAAGLRVREDHQGSRRAATGSWRGAVARRRARRRVRAGKPVRPAHGHRLRAVRTAGREDAVDRLPTLEGPRGRAADRAPVRRPRRAAGARTRVGGAAGSVGRCFPGRSRSSFPTPRGRFPWLTGSRTDTIGVRVPELRGEAWPPSSRSAASRRRARTCTRGRIRAGSRMFRRRSAPGPARCWTAASCPGRPRPSSTSPAPSRACCGKARRPRRRPSGASAKPTRIQDVAVAQETIEYLRTAGLAEIDPESPSCSAVSSTGSATRSS